MDVGRRSPSADAWCANLTDNGDRYIELMTGVYTDNQPDFTYIMPGETKVFTQVLVPHPRPSAKRKNATLEGALSLSVKDGEARFGALPTCERKGAVVRLTLNGKVLYEKTADLSPDHALTDYCPLPEGAKETDLCLCLSDASGKVLVSYQPIDISKKQPPQGPAHSAGSPGRGHH